MVTNELDGKGTATKPAGENSGTKPAGDIPPKDYIALRTAVSKQLRETSTSPTYQIVGDIAKRHGYELSDWYTRRIFKDLKTLAPDLWKISRPNSRARCRLRTVRSLLTAPERALLQTFTESLAIDQTEVLSVVLRVVAHSVARGAFPLTQLIPIAKAATDDEVEMLTSILKALNLSSV